jgi:hypothetical protein
VPRILILVKRQRCSETSFLCVYVFLASVTTFVYFLHYFPQPKKTRHNLLLLPPFKLAFIAAEFSDESLVLIWFCSESLSNRTNITQFLSLTYFGKFSVTNYRIRLESTLVKEERRVGRCCLPRSRFGDYHMPVKTDVHVPPPANSHQPGVTRSLLYNGSRFQGHQKSKGNCYDVEVVLQVNNLIFFILSEKKTNVTHFLPYTFSM